jgi:cytochrome P450
VKYNPLALDVVKDPYPYYRWLRDEAPLYHVEDLDVWAISRHSDVFTAYADDKTYVSGRGVVLGSPPRVSMLVSMDGDQHRDNRAVILPRFTKAGVAAVTPLIRDTVRELLDVAGRRPTVDLIVDIAAPLPMRVISELMNIPHDMRERIRLLCEKLMTKVDSDLSVDYSEESMAAVMEMMEFFHHLARERRENPGDDICSLIANTPVPGPDGTPGLLREDELAERLLELVVAGHETTTKLIGSGAVNLAEHPGQRRDLVEQPSLIREAIEEMQRFESPVQYNCRTLTSDVTIEGTTAPAGAFVLLLNGSADRDERYYPDPDVFNIHRSVKRHSSFGHGVHKCLGANLARLEVRLTFEELLRRHPNYEIDHGGIVFTRSSNLKGMRRLPISLN